MSRACVAGLQLTYTMVRAPDCCKKLLSSLGIPARAGSAVAGQETAASGSNASQGHDSMTVLNHASIHLPRLDL